MTTRSVDPIRLTGAGRGIEVVVLSRRHGLAGLLIAMAAVILLLLLLSAPVVQAEGAPEAPGASDTPGLKTNISDSAPLPTVGLMTGESRLLRVDDLKRVAVADPAVADVVVASTGEVLLVGKAPGATTLHVWQKNTVQAYLVRVFVDNSATEKELSTLIDRPQVTVKVVRDTVILDGVIATMAERERAQMLAQAFFGRVVNLLRLPDSPSPPAPDLLAAQAIADPAIRVNLVGSKLALEGTVSSQFARDRAVALAGAFGREVVDLVAVRPPAAAEKVPPTPDAQDIALAVGDDGVSVREIGGTFFLEGTVGDEFRVTRAEKIASALAPRVVNLLRVVAPKPEPEAKAEPAEPVAALEAKVTEEVKARAEAEEAARLAREEAATAARARDEAQAKLDAAARALSDREALLGKVKPFLPDGAIPTLVDGRLVVTGTVGSTAGKAQAEQVLRAFFPDAVVMLAVAEPPPEPPTPPPPPAQASQPMASRAEPVIKPALPPDLMSYVDKAVKAASAASRVNISDRAGRLVLTGTHPNAAAQARVKQAVEAFGAPVLDLTAVDRPAQVLLQVEMAEVTREGMDRLGINWGSYVGGVLEENQMIFTIPLPPAPNAGYPQPMTPLAARVDALAKDGKARLLAAPSLLTLDGKEAEFLAGGEIPVAVPDKDKITVYWKEYGVKLKMLPTVGEPGFINVHVRPEVSTLDWANGAKINLATLPALKTRRVETDVRLEEGQTLVIGGLITNEQAQWVTKLPVLGDLPVLGLLFRSSNFQRNETQLLVFVTPRILADGEGPMAEDLTRPTVPEALPLSDQAKSSPKKGR